MMPGVLPGPPAQTSVASLDAIAPGVSRWSGTAAGSAAMAAVATGLRARISRLRGMSAPAGRPYAEDFVVVRQVDRSRADLKRLC
jgi:hypothetical protein